MIERPKYRVWVNSFLLIGIFSNFGMIAGVVQAVEELRSARDTVETFQSRLIDTMKRGQELKYDGRYKNLDGPVRETHAANTISRIVLGKAWNRLSEDQKKNFIEIFTQLSIATYAHNFKSYSGEAFKFISETDAARGGKLIRTVFIESNGKEIQFDYLLRKKDGRWMIVNIIADGVSDLALKRSEYTSVLENDGYATLLEKLEKKIDQYTRSEK